MNQNISINVFDNSKFIGSVSISAESSIVVPKYNNKFKNNLILKNVPIVEKPNDLTPIQYCSNSSNSFANILLLEESNYQLSFKSKGNFNEDDIFYSLKNGDFFINPFTPFNIPDTLIYGGFLNFKSYVGKTFLDIVNNGNIIFSVPIEVMSKKINYSEQYSALISDLSQYASGLIFEINSPLYQSFELNHSFKENVYENFMFLEFLFRPENLPSTFEFLSKNLYSRLENYIESVPTSLVSNIGPDELIDMVSNSNNLYKECVEKFSWQKKTNGFIPLKIEEIKYKDNIDTPENRFYKNFLESIGFLINDLLDYVENGYIKDKLEEYAEEIDHFLSQRYFKDISIMDYAPLNSQVLQKKEGYRDILQYFLMLEFNFKMNWGEITNNFKGYEKKISELYEYWCYFELIKILENVSGSKICFEDIFFINSKKLSISLKKGNFTPNLTVMSNGKEISLKLSYNKTFSKNSINSSYSLDLRPDYTVIIELSDNNYLIHFDAKYKANFAFDNKYYKNQDIYKMHTYKDAISNSIGSFVFYPGNKQKIFYEKDSSVLAVGAFPLNPGDAEIEENNIVMFIKNLINELVKIN